MENKEVYIDGVDVSGCEHFSVHSGNGCRCYFLENEDAVVGCENYPNCYYKQLKRTESKLACKEQECEELKERLYVQAKEKVKYIFELDQLKEQLEAYKMEAEECKEINAELKATNEDLLSIQYKLADNNKRLRQTLIEIKKIANYSFNLSTSELMAKLEQILQKINECEVLE